MERACGIQDWKAQQQSLQNSNPFEPTSLFFRKIAWAIVILLAWFFVSGSFKFHRPRHVKQENWKKRCFFIGDDFCSTLHGNFLEMMGTVAGDLEIYGSFPRLTAPV